MNMMNEVLFLLLILFLGILSSLKLFNSKSMKIFLYLIVVLYIFYKLLMIIYSKNEPYLFKVLPFGTFYFDSFPSVNILEIIAISFYFIFLLLYKEQSDFFENESSLNVLYFLVVPLSSIIFKTSDLFLFFIFAFLIFLNLIFLYKNEKLSFITVNVKVSFIIYFSFLISFFTSAIFFEHYKTTDLLQIYEKLKMLPQKGSLFYLTCFTPFLFSFVFPINLFLFDFVSTMNPKQVAMFVLFLTFPSLIFLNKFLLLIPVKIIDSLFILSLISYSINVILLISPKIKHFKTFLFFTISNELVFLILFEHKFKTFTDTGFLFFYLGLFFTFLYSLSKFDFENEDDLKNSFVKQPTNSLIFFITSFSFTSLPFSLLFLYQYRFLLMLYNFEKIFFWLYLITLILKSYALLRFNLKMLLVEKRGKGHLINIIKNFNRTDFIVLIIVGILSVLFYNNFVSKKGYNFDEHRKIYFKVYDQEIDLKNKNE